jgi:type I restriction enzyme M protein
MGKPELNLGMISDLKGSEAVVAALIFLRWLDSNESELQTIATFEGREYEPILPPRFQWRSWHNLGGYNLVTFLGQSYPGNDPDPVNEFLPYLASLWSERHRPMALNLHVVGKVLEKGWYFQGAHIENAGEDDERIVEGDVEFEALLNWLSNVPFETPADRLRLLSHFDSLFLSTGTDSDRGNQSPEAIAKIVAAVARPKPGNRIYDPAFGAAKMLGEVATEAAKARTQARTVDQVRSSIEAYGTEMSADSFVIGLARLVLSGIEDPHLEIGNTLERELPNDSSSNGYDIVVADPPFGMRVPRECAQGFPIHSRDASSLFVQHALANARPSGRVIIVLPDSFFFHGGADQELRQFLLERNTVEAVISLPQGCYFPYSAVKTSILVVRRDGQTDAVRMVDAQPLFEPSSRRQAPAIREDAIAQLVKNVYAEHPGEYAWDVSIETLKELHWDLSPRRRQPSKLLSILSDLEEKIDVKTLSEFAEISSGRSIPSSNLSDRPYRDHSIPYVRIGDIKRGQVTRGSSWTSEEAAANLNPEWRLRRGDILLSKSGTIGKAGVIREKAIGGIASSGLRVIRLDPDVLDPEFAIAFLDSEAARSWLEERATGSVVAHLPIRAIRDMPIPVPPVQVQQRIVERYRVHDVDALSYLANLYFQSEEDPIAESISRWIDIALSIIPSEVVSIDATLGALDELTSSPAPIRECEDCHKKYWLGTVEHESDYSDAPHNYRDGYLESCLECWLGAGEDSSDQRRFQGGGPLGDWCSTLSSALGIFDGISSVPRTSELLYMLQAAEIIVAKAHDKIAGHFPDEERARRLDGKLKDHLLAVKLQMLMHSDFEFDTDLSGVYTGKNDEIGVGITNLSYLPLKNIKFKTDPDWGSEEVDYLGSQQGATILLSAAVPEGVSEISTRMKWSAHNIQGARVEGERELTFRVVSRAGRADRTAIGGSPYVCGDPIRPERKEMFFGREELVERIRRQVITSGNVVLLEGNRRTGKTSILRHLEGAARIPGWLCVYSSLQRAKGSPKGVGIPTAEVFREIARSVAEAVHRAGFDASLPNGSIKSATEKPLGFANACAEGISEGSAFEDLCEYIESTLRVLSEKSLGILLMLDEFDKLQEGIENQVTSPQVPDNIRYLIQTYPDFSAILTGTPRLKKLREDYWSALFGLGTSENVSNLSEAAARQLITEPVKGSLSYTEDAIKRLLTLTARQPYLLQCLCNRIFEQVAAGGRSSISIDLVEDSAKLFATETEHFASLWRYADSDRRRYLLALIHVETRDRSALRFGEISELLLEQGLDWPDSLLFDDIEFLKELEVIVMLSKGADKAYGLAIPLMGEWIEIEQDLNGLKTKAANEIESEYA